MAKSENERRLEILENAVKGKVGYKVVYKLPDEDYYYEKWPFGEDVGQRWTKEELDAMNIEYLLVIKYVDNWNE